MSKVESFPWFKFYPTDYLRKTRQLTLEQRGAYMDHIALQMERGGPLPDDVSWLAHQMHISTRKARAIVDELIALQKIRRTPDGISNERCETELKARNHQRQVNTEIAQKREQDKRAKQGGRPSFDDVSQPVHEYFTGEPSASEQQFNSENYENHNKINITPEISCNETSTTRARGESEPELEVSILSETSSDETGVPKRKPKKRFEYSEGFEKFWNTYPDTTNNSKVKAFAEWGKLTEADQATAFDALHPYKRYCVVNPNYRCVHAERYLRDRRFDSYAPKAGAQGQGDAWWADEQKLLQVTDSMWRGSIARHANGIWPVDKLGPPPGSPRCVVPKHIIDELGLEKKYDQHGMSKEKH